MMVLFWCSWHSSSRSAGQRVRHRSPNAKPDPPLQKGCPVMRSRSGSFALPAAPTASPSARPLIFSGRAGALCTSSTPARDDGDSMSRVWSTARIQDGVAASSGASSMTAVASKVFPRGEGVVAERFAPRQGPSPAQYVHMLRKRPWSRITEKLPDLTSPGNPTVRTPILGPHMEVSKGVLAHHRRPRSWYGLRLWLLPRPQGRIRHMTEMPLPHYPRRRCGA